MKFNKWTLGLAAVGVVSLASATRAEESTGSTVMTSLSSTTLSGFVDTSMQWNIGNRNGTLPSYTFGGPGKADGFNLNAIQLTLDKPLDETEWAAGYHIDLLMGPDGKTLGTDSYVSQLGVLNDFAIRQAYVALRMPVGNGLEWKIGVFDTIIGYEVIPSVNNPNYTRSYGFTLEPTTHTGILASYRFTDWFTASVGVANTFGPAINGRAHLTTIPVSGTPGLNVGGTKDESYKTYMASFALTAPMSWGWAAGSTLYFGVIHGFNSGYSNPANPGIPAINTGENQTHYYAGLTLSTPITGLRAGLAVDFLDRHHYSAAVAPLGNGEAWAVAAYASYQATPKLSFHGRAEYLDDRAGAIGSNGKYELFALTATAQYDLWKNVTSRLEFRWDHGIDNGLTGSAKDDFFGERGGSSASIGAPDSADAFLVAMNIIYKF